MDTIEQSDPEPEMTPRDERIARVTTRAAIILAVAVLALFAVASAMLLAGCSSGCSGHGGVRIQKGGWYLCNDNTWQPVG